jgi:hypothetical protein
VLGLTANKPETNKHAAIWNLEFKHTSESEVAGVVSGVGRPEWTPVTLPMPIIAVVAAGEGTDAPCGMVDTYFYRK